MAQAPEKLKRERNPDETRRRILDASEAEFARKGYEGTRLRDVAAVAGVHHALLHHYYKDKEGLFRAVVERALENVSRRATELLHSDQDVRSVTHAFVDTLIDFLAANQNLTLILHFASLDPDSPAYAVCEEIGFRLVEPLLSTTTTAIRISQEAGLLRDDLDAQSIAIASLSAVAFPYHADRLIAGVFGRDMRSPVEVTRHKHAAAAILLDGVLKR